MKITIRELKELIREVYGGSLPDETYETELLDDPANKGKSVLVPDDIKHSIKKWAKEMGLHGTRRRKSQ